MADLDAKDGFGFVNGTLHTTPELTAEDVAQSDSRLVVALRDALSPLGFTLAEVQLTTRAQEQLTVVARATIRSGRSRAA